MMALRCVAAVAVVCSVGGSGGGADAFSLLPRQGSQARSSSSRLPSSNFYDDFEGFGEGTNDGAGDSGLSSLQSRMGQVKELEAAYDAKLARNWRRGNWGVRGFALDKSSSTGNHALVSVVAATSSSSAAADISLPQDRALPIDHSVAVGRTDGSVFIIKLGYDYLTTFVEAPKLVVEQTEGNGSEDDVAVRVEGEWMSNDELHKRMQDEEQQMAQPGEETKGEPTPFEVLHQFIATKGEPINHLVFHDEEGAGGGIVCTASGTSSDINMWAFPSLDNGGMQPTTLTGVHSDAIISLKTMILGEKNFLFSASRDGTFALWNLGRKNGELIFSSQCVDVANDSGVTLTCADISNPSADDGYSDSGDDGSDVIFLGASNGYVFGYALQELLTSDTDPVPNLRFRAHGPDCGQGEAVTAIKAGGDGTIPSSARLRGGEESEGRGMAGRPGMSSAILLTGGEDGSVKQWEILSQKSGPTIRMEQWPRMSTQRMKRRAHLFSGHDGPVTSIAQQGHDGSKFLTCGRDGSVSVWSASSGEELYRMDGFSEGLSSLACLGRELLVTDGMEQFVCVHDFGIPEDAASEGYDLEW
ncbi:hypothetical protein ACHAXT_009973 [Thalassiosira profunda]